MFCRWIWNLRNILKIYQYSNFSTFAVTINVTPFKFTLSLRHFLNLTLLRYLLKISECNTDILFLWWNFD